jgi:hypothetical protein
MKKNLNIALIGLALVGSAVQAETRCEQISSVYAKTGVWSRDCGPEPGKPFSVELKKDCEHTARNIAMRPGASWNSEHGWASESECEALEREVQ